MGHLGRLSDKSEVPLGLQSIHPRERTFIIGMDKINVEASCKTYMAQACDAHSVSFLNIAHSMPLGRAFGLLSDLHLSDW